MTTMNVMQIDDRFAVITFDPERERFRGKFLGLTGHADFVGSTVNELRRQARISLKVYLEVCEENDLEPFKDYSGKLQLRMPKDLHEAVARHASAEAESINSWIVKRLEEDIA